MNAKLTFLLLAVLLSAPAIVCGQLFDFATKKPGEKFNPELVPSSAFITAAMFPRRISENPTLKLFPFEVVTAWGQKEFGFDPMLLNQITWVLRVSSDQGPEPALILHFDAMQGLAENLIGHLDQTTIGGKALYQPEHPELPWQFSYLIFDDATIIVGQQSLFQSMLTSDSNRGMVELINRTQMEGQALGFFDVKSARGLLNQWLAQANNEFELPAELVALNLIPDLLDSIEWGIEAEGKFETTVVFHAINGNAAEQLCELLAKAGQRLKQAMLISMSAQLDLNDPVNAATLQYTNRVWEKYEKELSPEIEGSKITYVLNEELLATPLLLGFFGEPVSRQIFKHKVTPDRQLKLTVLAFHNYESACGQFPPATLRDDEGQPLFHGRVAMLPYMEQSNLYQQLNLDEPWDSPHNKPYTEMEIEFISDPNGAAGANARIQFPVFPNSLWDDENPATGFRDITDGTSNTIMAIEAPVEAATNWADPTPWRISESNPMADIFGDREEVTVAMADGSTRVLKKSEMTNEKLTAMLTYAGGEVAE